MRLFLVLGNQLFDPSLVKENLPADLDLVFMREDRELCTYYKFHQHKIVLFLSAMRTYAAELEEASFQVHYEKMNSGADTYESALSEFVKKKKITEIHSFQIEDRFFETRIETLFKKLKLKWVQHETPMFLSSRENFEAYLKKTKKPFMKTYYESERRRLNILMDADGKPESGKFSFDDENRQKLPKNVQPPALPVITHSAVVSEVIQFCAKEFAEHPGQAKDFWLPVDRKGARAWLKSFFKQRFEEFGTYEDALAPASDFVFHSVLTPFLNMGLLTPHEVIQGALKHAKSNHTRLASVEGFIRQIMGWREFIRGMDRNFGEKQASLNFFKHHRKLKSCWYEGNTGIPPLDQAIQKAMRYGYTHHIERLMVVGSLMLLLEVEPHAAYAWFMEMYIDSSDWVMGPNVYGMALFSDGGIFATKPYICGSNYYRKMGDYPAGEWCDGVDGLYWGFIDKHQDFFLKNPRLAMIARTYEKMAPERKTKLSKAADVLRKKLVS